MPLGLRDAKSEWLEGKELWGAHETPEPHVGPGVRVKTGRLWRGESILTVQEDALAAWASARHSLRHIVRIRTSRPATLSPAALSLLRYVPMTTKSRVKGPAAPLQAVGHRQAGGSTGSGPSPRPRGHFRGQSLRTRPVVRGPSSVSGLFTLLHFLHFPCLGCARKVSTKEKTHQHYFSGHRHSKRSTNILTKGREVSAADQKVRPLRLEHEVTNKER